MDFITRLRPSSRRLIAYALFLSVFLLAYVESIAILFNLWSGVEETIYQYGFLVLACTCYLLYLKRLEILRFPAMPSGWALVPSLLLAGVWFTASLVGVQTVQLAVLPFLVLAITASFFGSKFLRLIGVPVLLLLFAIPLWWPLLPFLKTATTLVTEGFLRAIAKPVFVEGYFLHLPGGSFFVDDGCAGLRFLLVTLILGFMSVDMYALSRRQGAILLGTGVALALLANWIRVIIVVLVGDYTRMEHRLVADHNDLGWLVYAVVVLLPLFYLVGKLTASEVQQHPQEDPVKRPQCNQTNRLLTSLAAVFILVSAPVLSAVVRLQEFPAKSLSLPMSSQSWAAMSNSNPDWQANYSEASQYLFGRFEGGSGDVELHMINYAEQREGVELINVDNTLTDDAVWSIVPESEARRVVNSPTGESISVLTAEIESGPGKRKLLWYWFEVGGRQTTNTYIAKVLELLALVNGRKDAALIVFASDCQLTCVSAEERLGHFLDEMYVPIRDIL